MFVNRSILKKSRLGLASYSLIPLRCALLDCSHISVPRGGVGNSCTLALPPQNTDVAKDREIKLSVFLLAV
jgi:hypothetical protein